MQQIKKLTAVCLAFLAFSAEAAPLCGVTEPVRIGDALEIRFTPDTSWDVYAEDLFVRDGRLIRITNVVEEVPQPVLKDGQSFRVHFPHMGCTITATIGDVSGVTVQFVMSGGGLPNVVRESSFVKAMTP